MQTLVSIGIPVYKKELNEYEKISLQQIERILGNYPKIFIAPQSLEFNYGKEYEGWGVERFPDEFFQGTMSYSKLCLSINFYKRFDSYKFLLIYQLDAFVFSNRLEEFCDMDYDYIGAPWDYCMKTTQCKSYVGNGGFSLRKVTAAISLLKATEKLRNEHPLASYWNWYEDRFFSFCAGEGINGFRAAPANVAAWFAVDGNVRHWWRKHHGKLSFGCHDWRRKDMAFYLPILQQYGYTVMDDDQSEGQADAYFIMNRLVMYLCRRYLREHSVTDDYFVASVKSLLGDNKRCVLFGCGEDGILFLELLRRCHVQPEGFFDNGQLQQGKIVQQLLVRKFDKDFVRAKGVTILLTTSLYRLDIAGQLKKAGLIEGQDYVDLIKVLFPILRRYFYENIYLKMRAQ